MVKGLPGSCVVIPCSYIYPDTSRRVTQFTQIWQDDKNKLIYHPVDSKIMEQYRGRTTQLGDVKQNCTLKIDPLHQSDTGPFHFRIEIGGYNTYSYLQHKVSISMMGKLYQQLLTSVFNSMSVPSYNQNYLSAFISVMYFRCETFVTSSKKCRGKTYLLIIMLIKASDIIIFTAV